MKDAYNDLNCLKASLVLMGCHGPRMVCGFTSIKMCISSQCLSPLGTVRWRSSWFNPKSCSAPVCEQGMPYRWWKVLCYYAENPTRTHIVGPLGLKVFGPLRFCICTFLLFRCLKSIISLCMSKLINSRSQNNNDCITLLNGTMAYILLPQSWGSCAMAHT